MVLEKILDTCNLSDFVAIDLETTGLVPKEESIIEVSAVRYKNGKEESFFTHLLSPNKRIPSFIEDLTGIDNDMVRGKPSFLDVLDELIEYIGKSPIVGHNVQFDIDFIKYHSNDLFRVEHKLFLIILNLSWHRYHLPNYLYHVLILH